MQQTTNTEDKKPERPEDRAGRWCLSEKGVRKAGFVYQQTSTILLRTFVRCKMNVKLLE